MKLGFNAYGWQFEKGVKGLARSFRRAASAIDRAVDQALDAIREYQQHIAAGGDEIGEWDEDGVRVWTQDQVLDFDLLNAREAAMALRKAYALQLYHFWERSAQVWTSSKANTGHGELVEKTLAAGYPIDPRLEAVKHLANTLKHGNPKHGKMLLKAWPAVVPIPFPHDPDLVGDWYEAVVISEADVEEIARIVMASGPSFRLADLYL